MFHAPFEAERHFFRLHSMLHVSRFRTCSMSAHEDSPPARIQNIAMMRPGNMLIHVYSTWEHVSVLVNCPYYNGVSALRRVHHRRDQQHGDDSVILAVERMCYGMAVHSLLKNRLRDIRPYCEVRFRFGDMRNRTDPFIHIERRVMEDIGRCRDLAIEMLVRAAQRRRRQRKILALCMGMHPRLGVDSLLRQLPDMFLELHIVPHLVGDAA